MLFGLFRDRKQTDILETAIELFGRRTLSGVTTRKIADEAGIPEVRILQRYQNKANLYAQAANIVISGFNQQYAKFVLTLFGAEQDPARISKAVRIWYRSLRGPSARLLLQMINGDDARKILARGVLDQFTTALSSAIQFVKKADRRLNPEAHAKLLIVGLITHKVVDDDEEVMNEMLEFWLATLGFAESRPARKREWRKLIR